MMANYAFNGSSTGHNRHCNGIQRQHGLVNQNSIANGGRSTWFCGVVSVKTVFLLHLGILTSSAFYVLACAVGLTQRCSPLEHLLWQTKRFDRLPLFLIAVFLLICVVLALYGIHMATVIERTGGRYEETCNLSPIILLIPIALATSIYLVPFVMYTVVAVQTIKTGFHGLFNFSYEVSPALVVLALIVFWMMVIYWLIGVAKMFFMVWEHSGCYCSEEDNGNGRRSDLQKVTVDASSYTSGNSHSRPSVFGRVSRNDTTMAQRMKASVMQVRYDIDMNGDREQFINGAHHHHHRHRMAPNDRPVARFSPVPASPVQRQKRRAPRMGAVVNDEAIRTNRAVEEPMDISLLVG